MKSPAPLPFLLLALIGLGSCSPGPAEHIGTTASDTAPVRDLCYLKVMTGTASITGSNTVPGTTDSLSVRLHIDGDRVSGELSWLPEEKDRMTGTLQGTIQDDLIMALYTYSAEGMTTKEQKIMRIDAQGLRIKSGELEDHEGVWALKDTAAAFSEVVPSVPCR